MMSLRNSLTIDLSAIGYNLRQIRSAVPPTAKLLAVVKADAYGHGAPETARAAILSGADMLAVASAQEGIQLRRAGIEAPVLVLGAVTAAEVRDGTAFRLIQTVCSPEMVYLCEQAASDGQEPAEVHLAFDTGMGRIGVRNEPERDAVLSALSRCPHVSLTGAFTHFSDADGGEEGERFTREQFRVFLELTAPLPRGILLHCCNSAAIHRFPDMSMDMVRAGISLYGYPPVETTLQLRPCMSWKASVSHIKDLPSGAFVSYGRTYQSSASIRVATITCGYGDGYHRIAAEKAYVLIRGKRAKVIGRICMDQMMADITGMDDVQTGDEVVLIGTSGHESITARDLAEWSHTISYEVLLSSGSRAGRIFRENQDERRGMLQE